MIMKPDVGYMRMAGANDAVSINDYSTHIAQVSAGTAALQSHDIFDVWHTICGSFTIHMPLTDMTYNDVHNCIPNDNPHPARAADGECNYAMFWELGGIVIILVHNINVHTLNSGRICVRMRRVVVAGETTIVCDIEGRKYPGCLE